MAVKKLTYSLVEEFKATMGAKYAELVSKDGKGVKVDTYLYILNKVVDATSIIFSQEVTADNIQESLAAFDALEASGIDLNNPVPLRAWDGKGAQSIVSLSAVKSFVQALKPGKRVKNKSKEVEEVKPEKEEFVTLDL